MSPDLLTIGMATYGEFDGVWFTLTGLTANHPRVRYLVVDNTPERDPRTEAITRASGGTYLHRPDLSGTSRPRDAVFRYADTPWVMCIDSHVIFETGAVQAALDYCESHPDSRDLIQGPMVWDNGRGYSTHWKQAAPPGLWGVWDSDPRAEDREPFDIPMMGLGLWMMRKVAWPGFNPLFRGFGGEEGYTHEAVRQRGGRCRCLPRLRWRHKFRDVAGWNSNPHPPYPLRLEDHVWNLLVGHRELGIQAEEPIHDHFGKNLPRETWAKLVEASRIVQPSGGPRPYPNRQRILALWYSDNSAPPPLLEKSAQTITAAATQTLRHNVTVSACSWAPVNGFAPGQWSQYSGEKRRGYDTIVNQIEQAVAAATANGERYDAVAFCEHDVLYPPNYFDRIGDALAVNPRAPVVSHLDYIGLNATGWQRVRERHEPLHQLTLRWEVFQKNLSRASDEARTGGSVILEPDHGADRSAWVRLAPSSGDVLMPAVHVNHQAGRFTSHGDVCYEPIGSALTHPHWGEAQNWWPGPMTAIAEVKAEFKAAPVAASGGCGCGLSEPVGEIRSELPGEHWGFLGVRGRVVLDVGCGTMGGPDGRNTAGYFGAAGAVRVIGVDVDDRSFASVTGDNVVLKKLRVAGAADVTALLREHRPDVVKYDIEGGEIALPDVNADDARRVSEWAVEYHDPATREASLRALTGWGYEVRVIPFAGHDPGHIGVALGVRPGDGDRWKARWGTRRWEAEAASKASDFHEHVGTLRELAGHCASAAELSLWLKPADVAMAAGLPEGATLVSVCRYPKPHWGRLSDLMGGRLRSRVEEPNTAELEPTDLLFIDTEHDAEVLFKLLEQHHAKVNKYLVVHCTETFGENGDQPNRPGVMHALRTFCKNRPEWVVKRRDRNNHGLMVLSKCAEDVKELPSLWRKAMNYAAAMARHVAAGKPVVSLEVIEARQAECAVCPERALDACAACGCPLEAKLSLGTERCPKGKWDAAA